MLPPHLPANRKLAAGTPAGSARHPGRKAGGTADARPTSLKGPLKVHAGKQVLMIAKIRKEKARLC